jgi:hypothetical protein
MSKVTRHISIVVTLIEKDSGHRIEKDSGHRIEKDSGHRIEKDSGQIVLKG